MKDFDLALISKFRSELMGIAAIGILICHAGANGVELGLFLSIFNMGQLGNALFFMLSGYGLYFSLAKIPFTCSNIIMWYKKRLVRILVPYIIWCIPFFIYQLVYYPDTNWLDWLYVFSLLSYWDGSGGVAWFLSVLIALYLISPLIYKALIFRNRVRTNILMFAIISLSVYYLRPVNVTIGLICSNMPNLLAFIFGMAFGYFAQRCTRIKIISLFASGLLAYAFYFLNKNHQDSHMFHLGTCFLTLPVLCFFFNNINLNYKAFRLMGKISLESYLTNGALPRIIVFIPWGTMAWMNTGGYLSYLIVVIIGVFFAWVMHKISQPIIKII